MPRTAIDPAIRFWSHVDKNGPMPKRCPERGNCWIWTGYLTSRGYGSFREGVEGSKVIRAHHFLLGRPSAGLECDHACDTPSCVRPEHLDYVTHAQNMERVPSGKHNAVKTHCPKGHPYDGVKKFRGGKYMLRTCKTCIRESRR